MEKTSLTFKQKYSSYNGRRYGRPWAAELSLNKNKVEFKWIDYAYAGDSDGGTLMFDVEPDKAYAYGQRDTRGKSDIRYIVLEDGAFKDMHNQGNVRDFLIGLKEKA